MADGSGTSYAAGQLLPTAGNLTLYAQWTPLATDYIVTFDTQGGTPVPPQQTIAAGGVVAQPANPTQAGFIFGGWYKEAITTTPWDFVADTINSSTTIYAKWVPVATTTYTVDFNSQGGSAVPPATGVIPGSTITQPSSPTRPGFTFGGWFTDLGTTTPWNFGSDTVNNNITLYAKWTPDAVTGIPTLSRGIGLGMLALMLLAMGLMNGRRRED